MADGTIALLPAGLNFIILTPPSALSDCLSSGVSALVLAADYRKTAEILEAEDAMSRKREEPPK
jgi:hypothetical protein